MAESRENQQMRIFAGVLYVIGFLGWVGFSVRILIGPGGHDVTTSEIHLSAFWPVMCWCLCVPYLIKPTEIAASLPFRNVWLLGSVLLLIHIAIAYHLGHGWSHQDAWERTQQASGYGDGIFVSYTFALVWFIDAVWLAVAPGAYLARPRWMHWTIHCFLAFVVFNAAVVYGSWLARIAFVGCAITSWFVLPGWQWWAARKEAAKSATTPVDSK